MGPEMLGPGSSPPGLCGAFGLTLLESCPLSSVLDEFWKVNYTEAMSFICHKMQSFNASIHFDIDKGTHLCGHHHNQDIRQLHHPESSSVKSPPSLRNHWAAFCVYRVDVFPKGSSLGTLLCLAFFVCVCSIMFLRFKLAIVCCQQFSPLFWV